MDKASIIFWQVSARCGSNLVDLGVDVFQHVVEGLRPGPLLGRRGIAPLLLGLSGALQGGGPVGRFRPGADLPR